MVLGCLWSVGGCGYPKRRDFNCLQRPFAPDFSTTMTTSVLAAGFANPKCLAFGVPGGWGGRLGGGWPGRGRLKAWGSRVFRVQSLGLKVQGLGFRI